MPGLLDRLFLWFFSLTRRTHSFRYSESSYSSQGNVSDQQPISIATKVLPLTDNL
jgi:hypothetical protein